MKLKNWIQLFLLVGIISFGFYESKKHKKMISSCSATTKAIIIDKYTISSRGYFVKYSYKVEGKYYESSESLKDKKEIETFQEGSTIDIKYSCEDPNFSKYLKIKNK